MCGTCSLHVPLFLFSFSPPSGGCLILPLFHLSICSFCLFSAAHASSFLHPSVSLPPGILLWALSYRLTQSLLLTVSPVYLPSQSGFWKLSQKLEDYPHTHNNYPQLSVARHSRWCPVMGELLRWCLRLVMEYVASRAAEAITVHVSRAVLSWLSSGKGSTGLKYIHPLYYSL